MARLKQSFPSQNECAAAWALQTQDCGWVGGRNRTTLNFVGPTIYSGSGKSYALATFSGPRVVLFNADPAPMEINSYRRPIIVAALRRNEIRNFAVPSEVLFKEPKIVLVYMINRHIHLMNKAKRARENFHWRMERAKAYGDSVIEYANYYELPFKYPDETKKLENFLMYRLAKSNAFVMAQRMGRG